MSVIVKVHDATIKTATVEIKSLTVSGRQVTQALFRQLHEFSLMDEAAPRLRGPVWGYVNYCLPYCKKAYEPRTHRHYVWQWGDELNTCRLDWSYTWTHQPSVGMWVPLGHEADRYIGRKNKRGTFTRDWADIQEILRDAPQLFIAV